MTERAKSGFFSGAGVTSGETSGDVAAFLRAKLSSARVERDDLRQRVSTLEEELKLKCGELRAALRNCSKQRSRQDELQKTYSKQQSSVVHDKERMDALRAENKRLQAEVAQWKAEAEKLSDAHAVANETSERLDTLKRMIEVECSDKAAVIDENKRLMQELQASRCQIEGLTQLVSANTGRGHDANQARALMRRSSRVSISNLATLERSGSTLERRGSTVGVTLDGSNPTLQRRGSMIQRSGSVIQRSGSIIPEAETAILIPGSGARRSSSALPITDQDLHKLESRKSMIVDAPKQGSAPGADESQHLVIEGGDESPAQSDPAIEDSDAQSQSNMLAEENVRLRKTIEVYANRLAATRLRDSAQGSSRVPFTSRSPGIGRKNISDESSTPLSARRFERPGNLNMYRLPKGDYSAPDSEAVMRALKDQVASLQTKLVVANRRNEELHDKLLEFPGSPQIVPADKGQDQKSDVKNQPTDIAIQEPAEAQRPTSSLSRQSISLSRSHFPSITGPATSNASRANSSITPEGGELSTSRELVSSSRPASKDSYVDRFVRSAERACAR